MGMIIIAKKKMHWTAFVRYANLAFTFGITMIAAVFLGLYGGLWLDRRFDTFPIFMLLGVFLGIGIGFYSLWSELAGLTDKKPQKKPDRGDDEQKE